MSKGPQTIEIEECAGMLIELGKNFPLRYTNLRKILNRNK